MHLDDEQIQRLLHREMSAHAQALTREHLAECAACRDRVSRAEGDEADVSELLSRLDHSGPRITVADVTARGRGTPKIWGRWAAGVLLFAGLAGAAYAAPGSPIPGWLQSAAAWVAGADRPRLAPASPMASDSRVAGIAVAPGDDFLISFESADSRGEVRVVLSDGVQVMVRSAAGAARFASGADRLIVDNHATGATFDIEVPRAAPRLEIRVAGLPIFLKERSGMVTHGGVKRGNQYVIPLSIPGP